MIDDVAKTVSTFMADYRAMSEDDRPKSIICNRFLRNVVDPTDVDQFGKGDMKGDMGRKSRSYSTC